MDNDNDNWKQMHELSPEQLFCLLGALSDEMTARAQAVNPLAIQSRKIKMAFFRAGVCIIGARTHFRELEQLGAFRLAFRLPSAAPALPGLQHGAASSGAASVPTPPSAGAAELSLAPQCAQCRVAGIDHPGECRPLPDESTSSTSALTAESRAQRGPKADEVTGEAGRAEQGPVDLSHHLSVLKGGAA